MTDINDVIVDYCNICDCNLGEDFYSHAVHCHPNASLNDILRQCCNNIDLDYKFNIAELKSLYEFLSKYSWSA